MRRRTFVRTVGAGIGAGALAGCLGGDDDPEGTLTIATYDSMVDGEEPAGPWLAEEFESEYSDATIEWDTNDLTQYIQRADEGLDVEADLYLGLNIDDLARIDDEYEDGGLFTELDEGELDRADRVRDELDFGDPHDRVLAYDTGYISLVYDETAVDEPETFEDLLEPEYEDALLAQDASTSDPGQAFLLWTIHNYGEEEYLDYWDRLDDNGVRILGSWDDAYNNAYLNEERPMVVSYSTDQVYYGDEPRHQIAFLEDQGYANPEGMAIFEDSDNEELAYAFVDFALSNDAQAELAVRNVQFPAVEDDHVDLPEEFDQYAHVPPEPVTVGYDRLRDDLTGWIEEWARQFAAQ